MGAHMHLNLPARTQPVARKGEVRPGHLLKTKHLGVKRTSLFEIIGPNKIMIQIDDGHIMLPAGNLFMLSSPL